MTGPVVATCVTGAALAAYLWGERTENRALKAVAKPIASTGFIAVALLCGATGSTYGQVVLVALALSWVGDVALLGHARPAFLGGLVAFLLGHVGFCVAFVVRGIDATWALAAVVPMFAIAFGVHRWLSPKVPEKLRTAVTAYIVVISVMVTLATGTADPVLIGAATAFWLSDITVAIDRFAGGGFGNRLVGLPLYYGAQVVFAFSVG